MLPLVSLPAHARMCTPGGWGISLRITVGGRAAVYADSDRRPSMFVSAQPPATCMGWSYLAVALDTTQPLAQGSGQTVHYSHLRARALSRYLIQSRAARLVTRQSSPVQDGLVVLCPGTTNLEFQVPAGTIMVQCLASDSLSVRQCIGCRVQLAW